MSVLVVKSWLSDLLVFSALRNDNTKLRSLCHISIAFFVYISWGSINWCLFFFFLHFSKHLKYRTIFLFKTFDPILCLISDFDLSCLKYCVCVTTKKKNEIARGEHETIIICEQRIKPNDGKLHLIIIQANSVDI